MNKARDLILVRNHLLCAVERYLLIVIFQQIHHGQITFYTKTHQVHDSGMSEDVEYYQTTNHYHDTASFLKICKVLYMNIIKIVM